MSTLIDSPAVGDRFSYLDVEYVINRITVVPTGSAAVVGSKPPERIQIDAMAVPEVVRRRDNLSNLLEGKAAGGSGTSVREP